ncbi:MAG: hypothetical protein AAF098_12600 [Pseudomonadota bacterium]
MSRSVRIALLGLLVFCSPHVFSQDVSGAYTLTVSQDPGLQDCVWEGNLTLDQPGGTNPGAFTGSGSLTRVSGSAICLDLAGSGGGNISGNSLTFGLATGSFGTVNFVGSVTGPGSIAGTWSEGSATGTWSATLLSSGPATPVPVLPGTGLAILTLLTGVVGFIAVRRQRRKT